ncbi:winged helix-turn-helix domain-containing protein [Pseudomonas sp. PS01297]|uniref:winged helix-turn-helix domain-containing protein n=1 Tax=Pseudomonas sp. PS01297 TaxID=2991433 RepID=UPI002499B2A4|nr:winged helix-turn-helix domain-containing protein [Pseudomonas sp. PS01297]
MKALLSAFNKKPPAGEIMSAQNNCAPLNIIPQCQPYTSATLISTESECPASKSMQKTLKSEITSPLSKPIAPQTLDNTSTTYVPTSLNPIHSSPPQTWFFNLASRELGNDTARIHLTTTESLLINTLVLSSERICSKHELIEGINKDTHSYSGLEMCLSRLQSKFRATYNERLFRSVRNRGYCLVQDVKIAR